MPAVHALVANVVSVIGCWGCAIRSSPIPDFQRFAGTFVLTRPIARRRAGALFDLCAGFVYSQILLACVRLAAFRSAGGRAAQRRRTCSRGSVAVRRGGRAAARRGGFAETGCNAAAVAATGSAARRGAGRQSRRDRDDRASRHALQRPEGSSRAAARRSRGSGARAAIGPMRAGKPASGSVATRPSRPTPR